MKWPIEYCRICNAMQINKMQAPMHYSDSKINKLPAQTIFMNTIFDVDVWLVQVRRRSKTTTTTTTEKEKKKNVNKKMYTTCNLFPVVPFMDVLSSVRI